MNTKAILLAGTALAVTLSGSALAQDFGAEYDRQWGLEMIGVQAAWDAGITGKGVLVGVTDTGLELGANMHPEFTDSFSGLFFDGYLDTMTDTNGHGTHVAGIIAADRNGQGMVGVAYDSRIVALRLLAGPNNTGRSDAQITSSVLNYGMDNGVRLFNASWGIPGGHYAMAPFLNQTDPLQINAYRRLVQTDSVIVFATGNDRDQGINWPSIDSALPHYLPELQAAWLSVTSVDRTGELAWYAQPCEVAAQWCLAAPGGDTRFNPNDGIVSTVTGKLYEGYQGTSMAAPHVTGALALARELYPNASMQDLKLLVLNTARDIGAAGIDSQYGWGMLNVANMVGTQSHQAGAIYAQSAWAQAQTLDRVIDQVSTRRGLAADDNGTPFWFAPYGGIAVLHSNTPNLAGSVVTTGMVGGVDFLATDEWTAGVAVGASGNGFGSGNGNTASDFGLHGAGYVSYDNGMMFGDVAVGGGVFFGDTMRNSAPGLAGTVLGGQLGNMGQHTDAAIWGDARLGGHLDVNSFVFSPFVFARSTQQHLAGVMETGANALVLDVAATTVTRHEIGLGLELMGTGYDLEGFTLTPSLELAYGRLFGDQFDRNFALLGTALTGATDTPGPDVFHIGGGLSLDSDDGKFDAELGYRGSFQAGASAHAVTASFTMKF